jgi:hypothetical protein
MFPHRIITNGDSVCGVALALAALSPSFGWGARVDRRPADDGAKPRWHLTETRNFRIHSFGGRQLDPQIADRCEAVRAQIAGNWFPADADQAWAPKCTLVLHGTRAGYRSAVGQMSDCTVASCTTQVASDAAIERRIDVCASEPGWLEYLPHEITHVMTIGRLTTGTFPRWADEGMALVADPANKRAAHGRDLQLSLGSGHQFRMVELLVLADYPSVDRLGIFYGQSLSVVDFLLDRGGKQKFVEFVKRSASGGYDSALRTTYGIANVAQLETLWLAHARNVLVPAS